MRRSYSLLMLCGVLGCGPGLPGSGEAGSTTGGPGGGADASGAAGTTGAPTSGGEAGSAGSEASSGGDAGTSAGAATTSEQPFLVPLDANVDTWCDTFTQDCPDGFKCMPFADDGGTAWNNRKCVPVVADPGPLYAPCFAENFTLDGLDDCDVGLFCWELDDEGHGVCFGLCQGSEEDATCADPGATCAISGSGVLSVCLRGCDPVAQDCGPEDVCIANPNSEGFLCVLDASGEEGQLHDACEFANACDPGLLCNDPESAVECDQEANGCCEPFCDLSDPVCPGMGQVCNPWFEQGTAPPGDENVGFCAVP